MSSLEAPINQTSFPPLHPQLAEVASSGVPLACRSRPRLSIIHILQSWAHYASPPRSGDAAMGPKTTSPEGISFLELLTLFGGDAKTSSEVLRYFLEGDRV